MHHKPRRTGHTHRDAAGDRNATAGLLPQEQTLLRVLVTAQLTTLLAPYAEAQYLHVDRNVGIGCEDCGFYAPDLVVLARSPHGRVGDEPLVTIDLRLPGDATTARLDFYTAHAVNEALIADPTDQSVLCYRLGGPVHLRARSEALGLELDEIANLVSWPGSD